MTDITELAQSLKAAAENATLGLWYVDPDFDVCDEDRDFIAELHGGNLENNARFIALANPANVRALVEALEKAQAINAAAEKLVRCKGRYHSEQNYRALAALFGVTTPDLPPMDGESRTVKLPDRKSEKFWPNYGLEFDSLGYEIAVTEVLTAAGIKVEGE